VADRGGWYWIEVMPYDPNAGNSGLITNGSTNLALNLKPSIAYRITAVARGLKASTQVVLQSTFVRQKVKN
jgi:type IV pilus assembly protein PilX